MEPIDNTILFVEKENFFTRKRGENYREIQTPKTGGAILAKVCYAIRHTIMEQEAMRGAA